MLSGSYKEIIRVHREFSCCAGCCWLAYCDACRQEVTIEAPPGNLIGTIIQEYENILFARNNFLK